MESMLAYKFRLNPDTKRSKGIDSQIETARLLTTNSLRRREMNTEKTKPRA